MLGQPEHGLARRVPVAIARRLVPAVVEASAEAHLLEHLRRNAQPEPAQRARGETPAPRWDDRRHLPAEQVADLRQHQHAVSRPVEDAGDVVTDSVLEHSNATSSAE